MHGEPGGRTSTLISAASTSDFAAEHNPNGDGLIVSVVYATDDVFARHTASCAGWLILDESIYPVDVDAAEPFGLLYDGIPDDVVSASGCNDGDVTDDSGFGYSDFISYNAYTIGEYRAFLDEANELCETPTAED